MRPANTVVTDMLVLSPACDAYKTVVLRHDSREAGIYRGIKETLRIHAEAIPEHLIIVDQSELIFSLLVPHRSEDPERSMELFNFYHELSSQIAVECRGYPTLWREFITVPEHMGLPFSGRRCRAFVFVYSTDALFLVDSSSNAAEPTIPAELS